MHLILDDNGLELYGMSIRANFTFEYSDGTVKVLTTTVGDIYVPLYIDIHIGPVQYYPNQARELQNFTVTIEGRYHSGPAHSMTANIIAYTYACYGFRPLLTNFTISKTSVQIDTETLYTSTNIINNTVAPIANYTFFPTGNHLQQIMALEWCYLKYQCSQTFHFLGIYSVQIIGINEWGVYNLGLEVFLVTVLTYPASSHLSLFNSLSGFPLPSNEFKIFLGQPDFLECINFRTFFGSWNVLNHNGVINASLIINGTYESGELVDNYIAIEAYRNGLRSPFEGGMIYNTTTCATLELQIKVLQPTWIVLIYNPAIWEKDFYLEFTQSMVGLWYDIEIPFFNFTSYVDITHNLFYEIGIWIENATALISNMRVTTHYSWNGSAYVKDPYRLVSLANRQIPDTLIFDTPTESLCIQDYYNNTLLYLPSVGYTPFLDLALPIALMTFYNWENFTALIRIYRGLGTFLEIACPPGGSVTTEVFCTHYRVWVANQHLQELFISYVSPNQTRNVIIIIGTQQNVTAGQDFWAELWAFLFGTPLGITLFIVIVVAIALNVISTIYAFRLRRQLKQARQNQQKQKPGGWTPTVF
jgi:hypothetical protein